jgi:hypothetical protein
MVHALREAWLAVQPGGVLVDLRPLLDRWPIEVASAAQQREAGRATDLPEPLADDAAANAAMAEAARSGRWVRELQEQFPLLYYWDTPDEMSEYIGEDWSDVITVEEPVWRALKSAWSTADPDARVRLRMKMLITRYRKVPAFP